MKFFTQLIEDITHAHGEKQHIRHLTEYFQSDEPDEDKNQVLKLLLGQYPERVITVGKLKNLASELIGFPSWLIDRSEQETGNFIMTFALLSRPKIIQKSQRPISLLIQEITALKSTSDENIKNFISTEMKMSDPTQLMVVLKLLTCTFHFHIARKEIVRVLVQVLGITFEIAELRLFELERKKSIGLENLKIPIKDEINLIPEKFGTISLLNQPVEFLGDAGKWKAFGMRYGILAWLVKYGETTHLWTIDHGIVSDKFEEIIDTTKALKGSFAIYGQLVPQNGLSSANELASRIRKKSISKKEMRQNPVQFEIWSDGYPSILLGLPTSIGKQSAFFTRPTFNFSDWNQLKSIHNSCREQGLSGLILEDIHQNRVPFLWEAASHQVRVALIYLETGNIQPSGIESMTFGVRDNKGLVPIAKINAHDCDIDLHEIAEYARTHTLDRFGPVRTVAPGLIYELQFHSISKAPRRKSGILLSGAKIIRNVTADQNQADALETLQKLLIQ